MTIERQIRNTIILSLEKLRDKIIKNHTEAGQVASGRTARSLMISETRTGGKLTGRKAFATTETGRKGGKVPRNFTEIIKQWIIDKGISIRPIPYKRQASANWIPKYSAEQRGLNSLAGAIAYKIANEGTSLYKTGGRKDIFTEPTDETIKEIREKLSGLFKLEIQRL